MNKKSLYAYDLIFEVKCTANSEIHFSKRDDGVYIISKCRILCDGDKMYDRSSVIMNKDVAIELAEKILEKIK